MFVNGLLSLNDNKPLTNIMFRELSFCPASIARAFALGQIYLSIYQQIKELLFRRLFLVE